MGEAASRVAAFPEVRAALAGRQRAFAMQPEGAVLDGRDIGTVIAPSADVKIYVTASAEERARRRTAELAVRGEVADYEAVLADVRIRDERDSNRAAAPLRPARDAFILDTTTLDADAAFNKAVSIVQGRAGAHSAH
jgi:cytidylate kinase